MQIYEVALYVEEKGARAEFLRLHKAGFFKQLDEETMSKALLEGRFNKLLQIRLLRSVTPSQLIGEIGRDLEPRLAKTGNEALWNKFKNYVGDKSLGKGVNFMALIHGEAQFVKSVMDHHSLSACEYWHSERTSSFAYLMILADSSEGHRCHTLAYGTVLTAISMQSR